jgi:hypothetical protein
LQEDCLDVFKRYVPLSEWEALKAEMRSREEPTGEKAAENAEGTSVEAEPPETDGLRS